MRMYTFSDINLAKTLIIMDLARKQFMHVNYPEIPYFLF